LLPPHPNSEHKRSSKPDVVTIMKKPQAPSKETAQREQQATHVNRPPENSARLCNKVHTRKEADQTKPETKTEDVWICEDVISVAASVGDC
jgi:hypothetical protein